MAPALASAVLRELAPRFRRRLEAEPRFTDRWTWTSCTVTVSPDEIVTLHPHDGLIVLRDQVECSCLLAPKCLHIAAVVLALPLYSGPIEVPSTGEHQEVAAEAEPELVALNHRQREAVAAGGRAATSMLRGGASAFGLVIEGELLRAAHSCRIAGLHRLAGALLRVVERGREYRDRRPEFRLEALAGDLHDVLTTAWRLRDGTAAQDQIGTARRTYRPEGSLLLHGLFTEPVVSATGYAGVVTYLAGPDGRIWTVADVTPGDPVRCQVAYRTPVALGDIGLTHAALGRGGIRLQGATASADRRLGSGRDVRGVLAETISWTSPPVGALWDQPLAGQLDRVWAALDLPLTSRPAGSDLLFLRGRVLGVEGSALIVELVGTGHGQVACTPPSDHAELAYLDNLRLLGCCPPWRCC